MNVKYEIVVSSTYENLKDERNEVMKACLSMDHIAVGMEMFNAADEEPWRQPSDLPPTRLFGQSFSQYKRVML